MIATTATRAASLAPVEHADALDWLARQDAGSAAAVIYDPPYAVGAPVRGREDGAAGSVFGPMAFLSRTMTLAARVLRPGGIALIFTDWRRLPDMGYIASMSGLRPATCVAWVRNRPGTGGLLRASWDPILVAARGVPDAIDRAAVRNVDTATDYPVKRTHPYQKPPGVYRHILARACRPGDLVLDPFAGSASSRTAAMDLGLCWRGCDIDIAFADTPEASGYGAGRPAPAAAATAATSRARPWACATRAPASPASLADPRPGPEVTEDPDQ
jgi:DNA modification methylase